jgi:GxxExxY protein
MPMTWTKKYFKDLTYEVIGCAIEVHKELGPGLIESAYERCMLHELDLRGLSTKHQLSIPVNYKNIELDASLRLDILVEDALVVELKACEMTLPVHEAMLLTYMKLLEKPKGLLLNFNCTNIFKNGQKTMVNDLFKKLPDE